MKNKLFKYLLLIIIVIFIAYVGYIIYDDINTARIDSHEVNSKEALKQINEI